MGMLSTIFHGIAAGVQHSDFRNLIAADREAACKAIGELVSSGSPEQIDNFEVNLLQHSLLVMNPKARIRAMELYAFLKVCETSRFGFRGFQGADGPLN